MKPSLSQLANVSFTSLALSTIGAIATAQSATQFDVKTPPQAFAKTFEAPAQRASSTAAAPRSKSDGSKHVTAAGRPDHSRMYYSDVGSDVWARGATYKARLGPGGTELIPLFGVNAPQNYPLELELASVTVAGDALAFDATAVAEREADRIVYRRGALDEVYDLTPSAVEQSFVFSDLPARGALALRIGFRGEFTALAQGHGVRFAHELGAVECSGAVAYDKSGKSIALDVTLDGNALAIDLPAQFVAGATLPLTIDPILTAISVDNSLDDDTNPDVAYDNDSDSWQTVYEEHISQTDIDVYTAAFDSSGLGVTGSGYYLDQSSERWAHPRVAANHLDHQFFIVAEVGAIGLRQIKGVYVSATNQAHGTPYVISDNSNGEKSNPDIGGDSVNFGPTYYCVVYERTFTATDHDIHARLLTSSGLPVSPYAFVIENSGSTLDAKPSISQTCGGGASVERDWSVVWERQINATDHDVFGARVHCNGSISDATFPISTSFIDETNPTVSSPLDIDTNPHAVVVAYERRITAIDRDIELVEVAGHTLLCSANLSQLGNAAILDQCTPSIACDGNQFAVAFAEQWYVGAADYDIYVAHVAAGGNVIDETTPSELVGYSNHVDSNPALCAQSSGGSASPNFCAVWEVDLAGVGGHDILGAIVDGPHGGAIESYCGGSTVICPCGIPGADGHGCPNSAIGFGASLSTQGVASVSNDTLVFTSNNMPPTASCLFFQGTTTMGAPFGDGVKCVGGAIQRLGLNISASGSASYPQAGDASISVKGLVPVIGGTRYYQAWYRDPASFCTNKTFNMSNALKITWLP